MNKDSDKTKAQLLAELAELREKSKEQEDQLKAACRAHFWFLEKDQSNLISNHGIEKNSFKRYPFLYLFTTLLQMR